MSYPPFSYDWTGIPAPAVLAAHIALHDTIYAALDLPLEHQPQPTLITFDDGGGSSLVLDLTDSAAILIAIDHEERDNPVSVPALATILGLTALPGRYAQEAPHHQFSGAARWNGTTWTPVHGVPGFVIADFGDEKRQLHQAEAALTDENEGEADPEALAVLLAAIRTGTWTLEILTAALQVTPGDDEELFEEVFTAPDEAAAAAVLEQYRPVLRRARSL